MVRLKVFNHKMADRKQKHDDTRVSLDGLTIEEALKKAIDAGPYPEEEKPMKRSRPAAPRTKSRAPQSGPSKK